jgi:hypothetical protein
MRSARNRLIVAAVGAIVVLACDNPPMGTKFGNGISGGPTGTNPIQPTNPNSPDTTTPFAIIDTPATIGQLFNVGDSILVVTRIFDDRALASLELFGLKFTGDSSLGTLTVATRMSAVTAPAPGQSFPAASTALRVRRFLVPATPLDTSVDSLVILAVVKDQAGNIDSVRKRVQIVTGPKVTILAPIQGDSVAQGVAMRIQVHVTHQDGVREDSIRVRGDTSFTGAGRLDTLIVKTYTGTQRDVTLDTTILIPPAAPVRGRITITAKAVDVNRNPGSTNPVTVTVRAAGTTIPRVIQTVPPRFEMNDSLTITANGDGIQSLGVIVRDSVGAFLKRVDVTLPTPFTSNTRANVVLGLSDTLQGRRINISSFAVDQSGIRGWSVKPSQAGAQTDSTLAFQDTALVTFGTSYALPRAGTIGDIAVDEVRGHVFLSNLSNNRLELWESATTTWFAPGIPVGSAPWGLARSALNDTIMLVGNSGGTNITQVFIGDSDPTQIAERLDRRFRTRTQPIYEVLEVIDAGGKISITVKEPLLFSNRPQYVGQISNGQIYFSTKPTPEAPKGMIHWFNPAFPFPDLYSIVNYKPAPNVPNYLVLNADSVFVKPAAAGSGRPDTIVVCDHNQNTPDPSVCARAPELPPGDQLSLGLGAAVSHLPAAGALTDITLIPRVDINTVGYTDTSFVATSGDRAWIAFGSANTAGAGIVFMSTPGFFSPIFSQTDLTNNAAEHVFGLALDSTGITVAAHGGESYFASVDPPFHLRLQGKFATFQTGAGIAFHPGARGTNTPIQERLAFVASDNKQVQVLDVAHYIAAGVIPLKHQLYGPLRVTRRFPTDPPDVVLKLYGISLEGGLSIMDVRDRDLKPTP